MSRDTLLVVGAGLLHCYTIREAQAMGLHVIATDGNPGAPGLALADHEQVIDTADIAKHKALATALSLTGSLLGVSCAGGDSAPTVAAVAETAHLPGIPYDAAVRTWDKQQVRHTLARAGLGRYQPLWIDAYSLDKGVHTIGYPCIAKPCHQRGSRGITILRHYKDQATAAERLRPYRDPGTRILIEQYLIGSEHSAEIVLDASGDCVHFHICDRFFEYTSGIPIELGHINPSCLASDQQAAIKTMLLQTASAMGIMIGSWKCDVMWTADGPKILEGAARCSGGFDAQVSYPRSSGDNLLRRVIQVACGLPVTPQPVLPHDRYCAVAAIMAPKAGMLQALSQLTQEVIWIRQVGEQVQPPTHNAERIGFVVVEGTDYVDTWEQAWLWAQAYQEALEEVIT